MLKINISLDGFAQSWRLNSNRKFIIVVIISLFCLFNVSIVQVSIPDKLKYCADCTMEMVKVRSETKRKCANSKIFITLYQPYLLQYTLVN